MSKGTRYKIDGQISPKTADQIMKRAVRNTMERVHEACDEGTDWVRGETPIERALFAALWAEIHFGCHEFSEVVAPPPGEIWKHGQLVEGTALVVESQINLLNWPVDFVVRVFTDNLTPLATLAVECDGHDFHERTKEQAKKDRSRDRQLQAAGIAVFRFTGSEIHNNPCACADSIIDWAVTEMCWPRGMRWQP